MAFFRILVACMFGAPLFGCIVRVEICIMLVAFKEGPCCVIGFRFGSAINFYFLFFGLPLGFHARFQNTKKGLAPLV